MFRNAYVQSMRTIEELTYLLTYCVGSGTWGLSPQPHFNLWRYPQFCLACKTVLFAPVQFNLLFCFVGIQDMVPLANAGTYEGFEDLLERTNAWLKERPDIVVTNLQSVMVQKATGQCSAPGHRYHHRRRCRNHVWYRHRRCHRHHRRHGWYRCHRHHPHRRHHRHRSRHRYHLHRRHHRWYRHHRRHY